MRSIVVAPFSNSGIRDWPSTRYTQLIGLLLDQLEPADRVQVIGTPNQKLRANEIVRAFPLARVINDCGRLSWGDMLGRLRIAACVIGNNSGVTHLAGHFGVPTVCIFGGSHQRHEWRTLGPTVTIITRAIGCSPCQLDHGQTSPYDKACLRQIEPGVVADAVMRAIRPEQAGTAVDGMGSA